MHFVKAKSILTPTSMNIYRGCQHGCIYCDARSHCYQMQHDFEDIEVKENAVEKMKELYRTCIDLGEVTVNGQTGHQLQVYYGSSTFDSKEMSGFIDGIVSESKELGIQTMTPAEIERIKAAWQSA